VAGDWHGDDLFITQGLLAGERVVVDGAIRVAPGAKLKIVAPPAAGPAGAGSAPAGARQASASPR
jgi:membrane fusion protein (multidrug efflux system)